MKTKRLLTILCLFLALLLITLSGCSVDDLLGKLEVNGIRVEISEEQRHITKGTAFDPSVLKVIATNTDGTEAEIPVADVTVSQPDTENVGIYTVTVTYGKFNTSFTLYVEEPVTVTKLDLQAQDAKTTYIVGEEFDDTGITLVAEWSDGRTETLNAKDCLSGFDTTEAGEITLSFTYGGKTKTLDVAVKVPLVDTGIALNTASAKKQYKQHEAFSASGLVVTVTDSWGGSRVLDASEYTVSGGDTALAGAKTVTISFGDLTASYSINVSAAAIESFSVNLTKLTVEEGQTPDISGLLVTLKKELEDARTLDASEYTVSGLSDLALGENTVTVTLKEDTAHTATFTVVVRKVKDITLGLTDVKTNYDQHEDFSAAGLSVTANRTDGTSFPVDIADCSITGYDTSVFGTQVVTVTYNDPTYGAFSATYRINVAKAAILGITVDTTGVTLVYEKGQVVDLSGLSVKVRKKNEDDTVLTLGAETNGYTLTHEEFGDSKEYTVTVTLVEDDDFNESFKVIIREVNGITINIDSVKKVYKQHEDFSAAGLVVTANRTDGTSFEVTDYTVSDIDTEIAGQKTVTVSYGDFSKTYTVTVNAAAIESYTVDDSAVTKYFENGSEIDVTTGLVVKLKKELEDEVTLTADDYTVTYTVNGVGAYTVTVTLKENTDYTDTFTIYVFELTGITLNTTSVKKNYEVGEAVSLDNLLVSLNRGAFAPALTLSAQDYTVDTSAVNTAFPGTYPVTVNYGTFSASYNVVYTMDTIAMTAFANPAFVDTYIAATSVPATAKGGYVSNNIVFRVGDDNGFVFKPIAKARDEGGTIYTVQTYETAFELYEGETKLEGAALSAVVSYNPATYTYDFTEAAIGRSFTLIVSAINTTETLAPLSFTFMVVDGWNVYTAADLSRMANTNWNISPSDTAPAYNEKTVWDAYKLAHGVVKADGTVDDTPISGIVLQNSLVLTDADLPAGFFVTAEEDVTGLAVGHLKDWTYTYHHQLADGETFGIYGNGFAIDISAISSVYDGASHQWGYGSDYSNCDIFKFEGNNVENYNNTNPNTVGNASVIMQDITIKGNAMRTNDLEELIPDLGGMIGIKFTNCNAELNNAIITRSFIGLMGDYHSIIDLDGVKIYDSLQDAMFMWGSTTINVENSIMTGAGGPLIIMQHVDPDKDTVGNRIPTLNVDAASQLDNPVYGGEAWFINNGAELYAQQIIMLDNALATAAAGFNGGLSTYSLPTFTRKTIATTTNNIKYLNLVDLMMSNGVSVSTATSGAQGKTTIGDVLVTTTMANERVTNLRALLASIPDIGQDVAAQVIILENSNGSLAWTDGENLYMVTATNPAMSLTDFVTAEKDDYDEYGDPIDTSFFTEGDYLTVHAFGMAVVLKYN